MKLHIYIESTDAKDLGEKLLNQTQIKGELTERQEQERVRSFDAAGFAEIAGAIEAGAKALTALVALAAAIWKWRQEAKKEARIVLAKEEETERLLVDMETTVEEIEDFLKD